MNSSAYADLRRKSSSFSLHPQLEQLRQQKSNTPTPTVMSTASTVPNDNKECVNKCMLLNLIEQNFIEPTAEIHFGYHYSDVPLNKLSWNCRRVKCSTGFLELDT
jgi:hypothetical protein